MSAIKENYELLPLNTFHISAKARYFVELSDKAMVRDFLSSGKLGKQARFVLGGGSNVLFTRNFDGFIIHPVLRGIEKVSEDKDFVIVRVAAGEDWDSFVEFCVNHEWGGIENLSLIPGMVGASPVQNIGAYGVEVMDVVHAVEGYNMDTAREVTYTAKECHFAYRDSIFKNELKDKILVTQVLFRLHKKHHFKTNYPDLQKELDNYDDTTIANIRKSIMVIRNRKLPNPAITGNAGSFFKNPIVDKTQADDLHRHYPDMPLHLCNNGCSAKLSAAWLIDQCGWKGKISGNAATHRNQPLILINIGGATGEEILHFAQKIQKSVMNNFAIRLEMEVNVL
jgi:UDP-N-acetylmuramate dehydrogenase